MSEDKKKPGVGTPPVVCVDKRDLAHQFLKATAQFFEGNDISVSDPEARGFILDSIEIYKGAVEAGFKEMEAEQAKEAEKPVAKKKKAKK